MRSQGLSKKAVDETIAKAFKVRIDDPNVHHDKDKRIVGNTMKRMHIGSGRLAKSEIK